MDINKNQYLTLKHLSEDKENEKAPVGLTDAQYLTALKSLKAKGMVNACFEEGGGLVDAKLLTSGQATLDDVKDEEEHIIRKLINNVTLMVKQDSSSDIKIQKPLTMEQYTLLRMAREGNFSNANATNIFDVSFNTYNKQICSPLIGNEYLKVCNDRKSVLITSLGHNLLETIEKELAYELTAKQATNTNIAEKDTTDRCKLKLNATHRNQFVRDIITANEFGYFTDENGKPYNNEQVINAFADFLGDDTLKENINEEEILQDKELIEDLTKVFYTDASIAITEFIRKIRSTNSNTEKAKIAADYFNRKAIPDYSNRKTLWEILKKHNLYAPSLSNWYMAISNFLQKSI